MRTKETGPAPLGTGTRAEGASGTPAEYTAPPTDATRQQDLAFGHLARAYAVAVAWAGGLSISQSKADELAHHLRGAGSDDLARDVERLSERLRLVSAQAAGIVRRLGERP